MKKFRLSKPILLILLIALIISQIFLVNKLLKIIKPLTNRDEDIALIYRNNSEIETDVNLIEGDIKFEDIENLESYIVEYIESIDVSFNYEYSSDRSVPIDLDYKIKTNLYAYYKESIDENNNPKIWSKKDTIKVGTKKFESETYNINVPINIVLDDYLKQMKEFEEAVDLPIDGFLIVDFIVDIKGVSKDTDFVDSYTDSIKIPITELTLKVIDVLNDETEKIVYVKDADIENMETVAVVIFLTAVNLICLLAVFKTLFLRSKESRYDKTVEKILKNYDDIIINTSTPIELDNYNIIEILDFKELLNLAREYSVPIFNFTYDNRKVSMFYILKKENLYLYVIGE